MRVELFNNDKNVWSRHKHILIIQPILQQSTGNKETIVLKIASNRSSRRKDANSRGFQCMNRQCYNAWNHIQI